MDNLLIYKVILIISKYKKLFKISVLHVQVRQSARGLRRSGTVKAVK